jgi:hypothetical protein
MIFFRKPVGIQWKQQKATSAANRINPRASSVIPALIRSTGRNSGQSIFASLAISTISRSNVSTEFFPMAYPVKHPATIVNGTKGPLARFLHHVTVRAKGGTRFWAAVGALVEKGANRCRQGGIRRQAGKPPLFLVPGSAPRKA